MKEKFSIDITILKLLLFGYGFRSNSEISCALCFISSNDPVEPSNRIRREGIDHTTMQIVHVIALGGVDQRHFGR